MNSKPHHKGVKMKKLSARIVVVVIFALTFSSVPAQADTTEKYVGITIGHGSGGADVLL